MIFSRYNPSSRSANTAHLPQTGASVEQFLLIPRANLIEVLEFARVAREANDYAREANERARDANVQLEQAVEIALAYAGTVNFPQGVSNPTAVQPFPDVSMRFERDPRSGGAQRLKVTGNESPQYKYHIKRGGSGPTYADAVAAELDAEIFTLEEAWGAILPFLQPPYPEDWRHSLRRSLLRDKEQRFTHLGGEYFAQGEARSMGEPSPEPDGRNFFEDDGEE